MNRFRILLLAMALSVVVSCGRNNADVSFHTIKNDNGMTATFCNVGGRLVNLSVPAADGSFKNVVWGFESSAQCEDDKDYRQPIVGRYGNRIAGGRFDLDGITYQLSQNEGETHLHGGVSGFDKKVWDIEDAGDDALLLRYHSVDGEEGYPGNLDIAVFCMLTDNNELVLNYSVVTDAPTVINPTLHGYFNLHGQGEGLTTSHILKINADEYTPVDDRLIPTGEIARVEGTPFDFRAGKEVTPEFDHNFILRSVPGEPALIMYEPSTGIQMTVYTDQPGLQLYTGNTTGGVVLETQHFPDSPNHPDFPSTTLRPGEEYTQATIYQFSVLR